MRSRGVIGPAFRPFSEQSSRRSVEDGTAEEPWAIRKRMDRVDLAAFGCEPKGLGANAEKRGCIGKIEPGLDAVRGWTIDRNPMVRPERCHALSGPAIAIAGNELVPVENASNEVVVCDEREI